MVLPIHPNMEYANGREPLRPTQPFPFPNCFHWFRAITIVRIRAIPEGYADGSEGIYLPPEEHALILKNCKPFVHRMLEFCAARQVDINMASNTLKHADECQNSLGLLKDLFGPNVRADERFTPLVDLWYDLEQHFTADTIPNPFGLLQEQQAIETWVTQ